MRTRVSPARTPLRARSAREILRDFRRFSPPNAHFNVRTGAREGETPPSTSVSGEPGAASREGEFAKAATEFASLLREVEIKIRLARRRCSPKPPAALPAALRTCLDEPSLPLQRASSMRAECASLHAAAALLNTRPRRARRYSARPARGLGHARDRPLAGRPEAAAAHVAAAAVVQPIVRVDFLMPLRVDVSEHAAAVARRALAPSAGSAEGNLRICDCISAARSRSRRIHTNAGFA